MRRIFKPPSAFLLWYERCRAGDLVKKRQSPTDPPISLSFSGFSTTHSSCRAYVFVIRFKFASVDDRDAWFKKFKILAEYVADNEPTTLAYEAAVAEDDPLEVLAYERYA